ncbi:MAG: hypothetical protein AB7F86_13300 [Bdellovibrionales bacterium]
MTSFKSLAIFPVLMIALAACQTNNPPFSGPAKAPKAKVEYTPAKTEVGGLTIDVDPRVDILFVIDDSRSMRNHQKNLSRNIHLFVNELAKIKNLDFHIGYTLVHDSHRYGPIVEKECGGTVNWEDPGTLKVIRELPENRRFVTSHDDFRQILSRALDPDVNTNLVKDLINKDATHMCASGPEEEELFTPLLGSLENAMIVNGANKGFRRPGALFVAILISDAKDASGLAPETVWDRVQRAIGDTQKARVFTIGFKPGMVIGTSQPGFDSCKPDPAWAVNRRWPTRLVIGPRDNPLARLAELSQDDNSSTGGHVLSICEADYGTTLARFGTQIRQDALREIIVPLPSGVQETKDSKNRLRVVIGNQELTEGENGHWVYNTMNDSIVIFAQRIDWEKFNGQKIQIIFTPVQGNSPDTKPTWQQR